MAFLVIRRSKTPFLYQKVSVFLAIFDGKRPDFKSYKATMKSHLYKKTKKKNIVFVQILTREFYMNGLLVTMVTAERWHLKTCESQTSMLYISFPKFEPHL